MKITAITFEEYRWPRHKPISNGKHTYTHSGLGLVRVATDEGLEGLGVCARLGQTGGILKATVEHFGRELAGEDPIAGERLWHKMWVPKLVGRRGLVTRAISAIDIALWDIRAKVAQMPLYRLLGAYRERVPTYIAGGYYEDGKGLPELEREMGEYVEMGARAVKMKIGALAQSEDIARVAAARRAVGPQIKLLVDANCAYRAFEAVQMARRLEEYDVYWFEEPVAPDDYEGHRRVAQSSTIPVATGENEYTRYGFRDLIAHGAAAILNADALILGGISEFLKVAALAQAYDLDIAPHGAQEVHVHLVAAVANGLIMEFYGGSLDPMWGQIYHHTLSLNADGTVSPPAAPGVGLAPNFPALQKYRVG
ncbi:MAG: mandelate racemase/muconate lactonizing enzyme family protein [Chloroflexota bacterium]